MKQRGFRYCSACKHKLQKRGRTAAGTQRWLCPQCARSRTKPRPDLARALQLERFVAWLLGKRSQAELPTAFTGRSWRSQTAWCWQVVPAAPVTGEIHYALILDGIWIGDRVCLVARTTDYVVAWRWVPAENVGTWTAFLGRLPPPQFVVCDGQKGILKAIASCWPDTKVQRCVFHAWLYIRTRLTERPASEGGKTFRLLARDVLRIYSHEDMADWLTRLQIWEDRYGHAVKAHVRLRGGGRKPYGRHWRYKDPRLKAAHFHLQKLLARGWLFTYIHYQDPRLPSTTNHLEGGINSQLRTSLKLHRGMPPRHQYRLVDWYLYSRTEEPKPPRKFL